MAIRLDIRARVRGHRTGASRINASCVSTSRVNTLIVMAMIVTAAAALCVSPGVFAQNGLAPHFETADLVLVEKAKRELHLLKGGRVLRTFTISLGLVPEGHKERSGDFRTPEGRYRLTGRNTKSDYFLSILVDYPNGRDRAHARALGVEPGGSIMIHGTPNTPRYDERRYQDWDWTDGCIAVSNSDMVDIWLMTREGTPIEIRP